MRRWLLDGSKQWSFEIRGSEVLMYHRRLEDPSRLDSFLDEAVELRDHVPQVVHSEYGVGAGSGC